MFFPNFATRGSHMIAVIVAGKKSTRGELRAALAEEVAGGPRSIIPPRPHPTRLGPQGTAGSTIPGRATTGQASATGKIVCRTHTGIGEAPVPARLRKAERGAVARSFGDFDRADDFANHLIRRDPLQV